MTTSQQTSFIFDALTADRIPESTLVYFRERFKNKLHAIVLQNFIEQERANAVSKADIARKLDKDPSQITRWLKNPGNLTIGSVSDLLLALGSEPSIESTCIVADGVADNRLPDWLLNTQQTAARSEKMGVVRIIHNAETANPNANQYGVESMVPYERGKDETFYVDKWVANHA